MRVVRNLKGNAFVDRGFTLLELVIAIMVLSIGTLAIVRTLDQSRRQIGEASARYLAQTVVENRGAELRVSGVALGRGLPERIQQGPYEWQIVTVSKKTEAGIYEVSLTAQGDDLPGAQLVIYTTWGPPR
jgi:general secretion pathway protein I